MRIPPTRFLSPMRRVSASRRQVMLTEFAQQQTFTLVESLPERVRFAFRYYGRLSRLLTYLGEHIDEPITLAQAAELAGMEKTAFCKFFRRITGVTFMACLHTLRLNQAIALLKLCDLPIIEISFSVGYASVGTFQRHFKIHTGISPREYRSRFISVDAA